MAEQIKSENANAPVTPEGPKPVKFIHEKGTQYRIYHADTGWGTINSAGNVQIDFCVERPQMPSYVVQPVDQDGNARGEQINGGVDDTGHFVVVRDFQCGVVLSLPAAQQIHALLTNYLKTAKEQMDLAMKQLKAKQTNP